MFAENAILAVLRLFGQQRVGARYEDIPRRIPNSAKAQQELGWSLQVDVAEGVRRTIEWARANPWYLQ